MRTIAVTGAAGFIGCEVVARLSDRGDRVIALDDLSVGRQDRLATRNVLFHRTDIRDTAPLTAILEAQRPAAILHLAAVHHIPTCEANPVETLSVNVVGTESVLAAAAACGTAMVVIASSGAVYDWADGPLAESAPLKPHDVYSLSKSTNEAQLARWSAGSGIRGRIARLFNIVGPDDPNAHLIPDLLSRLAATRAERDDARPVIAIGATATVRDYVDVRDAAEALLKLLDDPAPALLDIFNICGGQGVSTSDLARLLAGTVGIDADFAVDPALLRRIDRPSQVGDPQAMTRRFGWRASIPLEDSLRRIAASSGWP